MPALITVDELDTQLPEILEHVGPRDRPEFLNPQGDALRAFALDTIQTWYWPAKAEWDAENVPEETVTRIAEALAEHFQSGATD